MPQESYGGFPYARQTDDGGLRVVVRVELIECPQCGHTLKFVPDAGKDETIKRAQHDVLLKVVSDYWKTSGKLGQSDLKLWEQTQSVLKEAGLLDKETDMSRAVTNNYLPN